MEMTDPESRQNLERGSSNEANKLHVSQVSPDELETQETQWLRMDPSLTRAVLAKTEEELLGGLAALMRSKVEHEQVNRRLAQAHIENQHARRELEAVKDQTRHAEQEVATRLNEQARLNEEINRIRVELDGLRQEHRGCAELVTGLKNELSQTRQSLDEARQSLNAAKKAIQEQVVAHRETLDRLTQAHHEKRVLEGLLVNVRAEVDGRIQAREALIVDLLALQDGVSELTARRDALLAESSAMGADHADLHDKIAGLSVTRRNLLSEIAALESRLQELATSVESAEKARNAEGLPLLFGVETQKVASEWDAYALESEFHTEEELNAHKVAELVAKLPGLDGCMLVKNHGPVLASRLGEQLYDRLKVPNRNYQLLFERLEDKVEEYNVQNARLATYRVGEEALTIAQASHAFLFASHKQAKLRPGLANKLASVVAEISKMYP
jgi:chromosome segregation ATPase